MSILDSIFSNPDVPTAPDYNPLIQASKGLGDKEQSLGASQLDWAKDQFSDNKGVSDQVTGNDLSTADRTGKFAGDLQDQYQNTYAPLGDKFAKEAEAYSNPDRIADNMGRAQATTAQQFDQARQGAQQELESYGISPDSTRFGALDIGLRAQKAAAMSAAGNNARTATENTGLALEGQAIQQGQALPGMAAGTANTALQAGSQAVNSGLATTASGANTMGTTPGYMNMANGAYGMSGNMMNQQYGNQMAQYTAQNAQSSGVGQLAGMAAGALLFAKGGAVPLSEGNPDDGPFVPHHFYTFDSVDEAGHKMPVHEALHRVFKTGVHSGMYASPEHALFACGGMVGSYAEGGDVGDEGAVPMDASPSNGAVTDDVSANGGAIKLNAGEFVLPKDVTAWLGQKQLQNMITKAREESQGATAKPTVSPKKQAVEVN